MPKYTPSGSFVTDKYRTFCYVQVRGVLIVPPRLLYERMSPPQKHTAFGRRATARGHHWLLFKLTIPLFGFFSEFPLQYASAAETESAANQLDGVTWPEVRGACG